jgi:hypothetical protein
MSLSKNTLVLQNELKSTLNKKSVTGGRSVENNTTFLAVSSPLRTMNGGNGNFNIIDETGRIVGTISSTVYGFGETVVNIIVGTSGAVVNAAGNIVIIGTHAIEGVTLGIFNSGTGLIKRGINTTTDLVTNGVKGFTDMSVKVIEGTSNAVNTGVETVGNVSKHLINGASNIVETGINTTADFVNGGVQSVKNVVNKGVEIVEDLSTGAISGTKNVLTNGINSGQSVITTGTDTFNKVSQDILSGTSNTITNGLETGKDVFNTGVNTVENASNNLITGTADAISGTVNTLRSSVLKTPLTESQESSNGKLSQSGGIIGGVSVLNIQDSSDVNTRMLISNNFLDSKHVYFVRYHPNGTNVYDYKFGLKGGKVNNLELRNVNSIWNNGNSVGSISNNTLSNSINVINNVIADLSNSPQVGGYVRNYVMDKNDFYNEYKKYKLKYLALL